jgi:hypothetical protein
MKRSLLGVLAAAALSSSASAATFGFDCFVGSPQTCAVGEASLSVDVVEASNGSVTLTISNSDIGTTSVTAVYLEDADLVRSATVADSVGTNFRSGGKPKHLQGAGVISFQDDFRFTARKPRGASGVQGGESLTIVLSLRDGAAYADVLSALEAGEFRIALRLEGDERGCASRKKKSECVGDPIPASLVNRPNAVPEPMPAVLGSFACLGLALFGRRR